MTALISVVTAQPVIFSATCHISMSWLMLMLPVWCLYVHLIVQLIERDNIVQQKVEMGTWQDRSVSWLPVETDPDCSISWSQILLRQTSEAWKLWSFALQRHPTACMLRYLSICRVFLFYTLSGSFPIQTMPTLTLKMYF